MACKRHAEAALCGDHQLTQPDQTTTDRTDEETEVRKVGPEGADKGSVREPVLMPPVWIWW